MTVIYLSKMEENFLFLNSLGHYTEMPESSVKAESVDVPVVRVSERKRSCEVFEETNTGYDLFPLTRPDSNSTMRMKIEPAERPCRWDPKPNGEIQPDPDPGYDIYQAGLSNSSLNIIVKNEPEEEPCIWRPDLNGRAVTQRSLDVDESHLEEFSQSQQQAERERQRNVRFSEEENDILINSIMPHYDKLFGRLAARHSTAVKNSLWREIASSVNAISAYPRSVQNCKKRYADIKRKVKDKLSKISKHKRQSSGAGVPLNISFWPYERVMEKMISADIMAGVPGATDSGRMPDPCPVGQSEHDLSELHELVDEEEAGNAESEDCQMGPQEDPNEEEYLEEPIPEAHEGRLLVQEEVTRENKPELPFPCSSTTRQQSIRDHTTLIYAEQSHFRRTMSHKLNLLNNNVKALNRSVEAFQKSFGQSMASLSEALQQQNSIFEKLASNLLVIAEQQQQHNKQCMSGMQQMFRVLSSHSASPSPTPSESPSDGSPAPTRPAAARRGPQTHWRMVRRRNKGQSASEQAPKKRRH